MLIRKTAQLAARPLALAPALALSVLTLAVQAGCSPDSSAATAPLAAAADPAAMHESAEAGQWVEVRRERLAQYTPTIGTFRARQVTRIGPQVSGRVQEVLADVGSSVTQGQVLVKLDPTFFEIETKQQRAVIEAARGALARSEANLADAERELRRQNELFERGAGSVKEHEDAITAQQRAQGERNESAARLEEALARLNWLEQRLTETQVTAPYDGVITARLVDPGDSASMTPVTELLEIQDVAALYLEFALPQELLARMAPDTAVRFQVDGLDGPPQQGTVETVFPAIDEATRSFRCRVIVPNAQRRLQPGLLARVEVQTLAIDDALVVPRSALRQTARGWEARRQRDGAPAVQEVEAGLVAGDSVQILAGLTAGDRVWVP